MNRQEKEEHLRRRLVDPTAPMPPFENLPAKKLNAIVTFLAQSK